MIDNATKNRIFETSDILEVVGDFVSLKKKGTNYLGNCPFHNEKTPSFTVSPAKGIYKCFGCGEGGNSVNFIMKHESVTYPEALKYLAKKFNIEVIEKELTQEEKLKQGERESMLTVSSYAAKFFQKQLTETDEGKSIGRSYFYERGFTDEIIQKFGLGYSPEKRDAFSRHALLNGYKLDYLVSTGLSIKSDNRDPFDRFSGRVMFPIYSLSGNPIAFGGRTLRSDKKIAKYLNSPESEVYHKSFVLYGLYHARREISKYDKCFMVEGYTDVISMHQAGIENVVSSSGTSLTVDQIRLLRRFTKNITILYDGDAAGIKASMRGIDLVLEEGLNVKIVSLPEGEDPDSFSKKNGAEKTLKFIDDNESDFIVFKAKLLSQGNTDPIKRAAVISDIIQSVSVIPDAIIRNEYIKECSKVLDVNQDVLYAELEKDRVKKYDKKVGADKVLNRARQTQQPPVQPMDQKALNPIEAHEKEILRLLIVYGDTVLFIEDNEDGTEPVNITVAQYIIEEIVEDNITFASPVYNSIFTDLTSHMDEEFFKVSHFFKFHPKPEISSLAATLIASTPTLSELWRRGDMIIPSEEDVLKLLVPETISSYKLEKLKETINDFDKQIETIGSNPEEISALTDLIMKKMILQESMQVLIQDMGKSPIR